VRRLQKVKRIDKEVGKTSLRKIVPRHRCRGEKGGKAMHHNENSSERSNRTESNKGVRKEERPKARSKDKEKKGKKKRKEANGEKKNGYCKRS